MKDNLFKRTIKIVDIDWIFEDEYNNGSDDDTEWTL